MTLKQMLDDKDKKINDLRIEMNGKIEGAKLELKNEIKNEIKDLNEIKRFWITGLQIEDNFEVLKGRISYSYYSRRELYLSCTNNSNFIELSYVDYGAVSKRRIDFTEKMDLYMPVSLGKYLGLEPR